MSVDGFISLHWIIFFLFAVLWTVTYFFITTSDFELKHSKHWSSRIFNDYRSKYEMCIYSLIIRRRIHRSNLSERF